MLGRNPSFQNTIPESLNESEDEAEDSPTGGAEVESAEERRQPVDTSRNPSADLPTSPAKNVKKATKGNQRASRTVKADEVSEMRGYSTLPRSRGQKSVSVSQQQVSSQLLAFSFTLKSVRFYSFLYVSMQFLANQNKLNF